MKSFISWTMAGLFVLCSLAAGAGQPRVVIHEVAWMGTREEPDLQWIELYNPGEEAVPLHGWLLLTKSGSSRTELEGTLHPGGSLLLASRTNSFLNAAGARHRLDGTFSIQGEAVRLLDDGGATVDQLDAWHAGDLERAATMQRVYPYGRGDEQAAWKTATVQYDGGYGTPGFRLPPPHTGQQVHQVFHGPGTINIFFNQSAFTDLAFEGNEANHQIDLEERIIDRIYQARERIDMAAYDLNLEGIVEALLDRAAEGIQVRVVVDAKSPGDDLRHKRYTQMRALLERLRRGRDGIIGTGDDVHIFANSPIMAIGQPRARAEYGLPPQGTEELERVTLEVGRGEVEGYLLAEGMKHPCGTRYYAPGGQMHNKFLLIDDYRLITGSMNLTQTGTFGDEAARQRGEMRGNANNMLDIHSPEIVALFREEFDQMWGGTGAEPCPELARFRGLKADGRKPHRVDLHGVPVKVFFSPGYNVIPAIASYVERHARESVFFCIFAWSDSTLENVLKRKWEASADDLDGEPTGFRLYGVFERIFWNQWWSANNNMLGRTVSRSSRRNPNIRWQTTPPIYRDGEVRKMHHKYMLIDADTAYTPSVITGSANWSRNANEFNDENTLIIQDARIANQYVQEFFARYSQAGADVDLGRLRTRLAKHAQSAPNLHASPKARMGADVAPAATVPHLDEGHVSLDRWLIQSPSVALVDNNRVDNRRRRTRDDRW